MHQIAEQQMQSNFLPWTPFETANVQSCANRTEFLCSAQTLQRLRPPCRDISLSTPGRGRGEIMRAPVTRHFSWSMFAAPSFERPSCTIMALPCIHTRPWRVVFSWCASAGQPALQCWIPRWGLPAPGPQKSIARQQMGCSVLLFIHSVRDAGCYASAFAGFFRLAIPDWHDSGAELRFWGAS